MYSQFYFKWIVWILSVNQNVNFSACLEQELLTVSSRAHLRSSNFICIPNSGMERATPKLKQNMESIFLLSSLLFMLISSRCNTLIMIYEDWQRDCRLRLYKRASILPHFKVLSPITWSHSPKVNADIVHMGKKGCIWRHSPKAESVWLFSGVSNFREAINIIHNC